MTTSRLTSLYQGMSDQPDCCGTCGARLELIEIYMEGTERVFACECLGCHRHIKVVEMENLDDKLLATAP